MPSLVISVNENGEIQIDAKDFKGRGCMEASRPFEDAFGQVESRKMKPELHSTESQGVSQVGRTTIKR